MSSMACNKEKLEDYIAALETVVNGNVAEENLQVILKDAKKMHDEAGIKLTKDFYHKRYKFYWSHVL